MRAVSCKDPKLPQQSNLPGRPSPVWGRALHGDRVRETEECSNSA
jgi:hypothetical protein